MTEPTLVILPFEWSCWNGRGLPNNPFTAYRCGLCERCGTIIPPWGVEIEITQAPPVRSYPPDFQPEVGSRWVVVHFLPGAQHRIEVVSLEEFAALTAGISRKNLLSMHHGPWPTEHGIPKFMVGGSALSLDIATDQPLDEPCFRIVRGMPPFYRSPVATAATS